MKDARLEQITSGNSKTEKDLRNKIQHLEAELTLIEDADEIKARQDVLELLKQDLQEIEDQKPQADEIVFEGRVNIRLSTDDGFYLFSEADGNIDRGQYYYKEWGITKVVDLLDGEIQQVMDYFNIDDTTYRTERS